MAQDILVIGEIEGGAPSSVTAELLGAATRLADGGTVSVALLGAAANDAAAAAFAAGADKAFVGADAAYDEFQPDQWLAAAQAAVEQARQVAALAESIVVSHPHSYHLG